MNQNLPPFDKALISYIIIVSVRFCKEKNLREKDGSSKNIGSAYESKIYHILTCFFILFSYSFSWKE